ncbi:MAG TPA: vitamin K epoxide reductase family protein [Gemmatimonadaceae bacterium]|nr:vitamin K epoxide reductase family protein [Gemmatimonadaceae bacterium]
MNFRRAISLLALVSGLVALYLHLWKIGMVGALSCGVEARGCEYVQLSPYGWFLGYDVALIGTWGYAAIFTVATIGGLDRFANSRWPTIALMALIWPAVLFTIRLKYAEWFILRGFCTWCLVSTVTITVCAILVTLDLRRVRGATAQHSA